MAAVFPKMKSLLLDLPPFLDVDWVPSTATETDQQKKKNHQVRSLEENQYILTSVRK